MDENDMSMANQTVPSGIPSNNKVLSQAASSPLRRKQAVPAAQLAEERPVLQSKLKAKQPYLKRGTGLQNRQEAAKQRRYVPKGGFIKGQAEDEVGYQQNVPVAHKPPTSQSQAGRTAPVAQPHHFSHSLAPAEEIEQTVHQPLYSVLLHDQNEVHRHANRQLYPSAADTEAELDADTALVHFPGGMHVNGNEQACNIDQQPFQRYLSAPQPTDAMSASANKEVAQQLSSMHSLSSLHEASQQSRDTNNAAGSVLAPVDWHLQQAAEALELEEFRALERQITQDSSVSVRGSVASMSNAAVMQMRNSTDMLLESQHQQQRAASYTADQQPDFPQVGQRLSTQQKDWQNPASSQLVEPNASLHAAAHSFGQASRQKPGSVTGNPFADPPDFSGPGSILQSHQGDQEDQGFEGTWTEAAVDAWQDKAAQSCDQPPMGAHAEQQNAFDCRGFNTEYAWDTASVAEAAATKIHTSGQGQQGGLNSNRASQSYIQQLFRQQQPQKSAVNKNVQHPDDSEAAAIAALEQEMNGLQEERARVGKLRTQLEQASTRMQQEKAAWERHKSEQTAAWEAEREADSQRLKRHQRVLDKQSRALLKLPNRKERSEVEAVEAVLEQERKAGNAKDARHKLTVERLRQKLVELQDTNAELREEIRFHEQRRLKEWNSKENQQPKAASRGRASGAPLSETATSTNRSKPAVSPQEASSKATGHASKAALQQPPTTASEPPCSVPKHDVSDVEAAHATQLADDASEADYEDVKEALRQSSTAAQAHDVQWQVQKHDLSGHAYPLPGESALGDRATLASRHVGQPTYSSLHASARTCPPAAPASTQVARPVNAFQPIEDTRMAEAWIAEPAPAQQQPGVQAASTRTGDRYQHATSTDSPDQFVWQPIPPQGFPEAWHGSFRPAGQADVLAAAADPRQPTRAAHVPSNQQGHKPGAQSLRQSLDAAARLDERLQGAQQQKQQQQQVASHRQQQQQQRQHASSGKEALAGSLSWQDLHEAYAAEPAVPAESAAVPDHHHHDFQQQQQQQHWAGAARQSQSLSRGTTPDGPILMDRSRPRTAADATVASVSMGQALPQSSEAQGLPGSWASYNFNGYFGHKGLGRSRGGADDQAWVTQSSANAVARPGIPQMPADTQQWMTGHSTPGADQGKHTLVGTEHSRQASADSTAADNDTEQPYQELLHPDGKVEQIFLDGRRIVLFGNGTRKHQFPDGHTAIRFTNKDIKRFFPCGRVEYYYCEVDTWHTTHANGIEVFYFPNGQTEAHHPSGSKEIIFSDGVIRRVCTDGREQDVTPEQLSSPVKYPMPEDKD